MIPVCRKYKLFALYLILKNFVLVKGMELSTLNKRSSKIKNGAREMHNFCSWKKTLDFVYDVTAASLTLRLMLIILYIYIN